MNQMIQIQNELSKKEEHLGKQEVMLERAKVIAKEKGKVKRVTDRSQKNFWLVWSSNEKTPEKGYDVTYDEMLGIFTCTCPHFENRLETCEHNHLSGDA